jgi:hypothetical protein
MGNDKELQQKVAYEKLKNKGTLYGVPRYGNKEHMKTLPEGLYLGLYHGFKDIDARNEADEWGEDGPMIGPLKYVHTTYACDVKFEFTEDRWTDFTKLNKNDYLTVSPEDCLLYGGMEYGDWTVFYHKPGEDGN